MAADCAGNGHQVCKRQGKAGSSESPHRPVTKRGRSAHTPWTRAERVPPRRSPGVACEAALGVTCQALLLDVKEALVDEFVDAEGA